MGQDFETVRHALHHLGGCPRCLEADAALARIERGAPRRMIPGTRTWDRSEVERLRDAEMLHGRAVKSLLDENERLRAEMKRAIGYCQDGQPNDAIDVLRSALALEEE